MQERRSSTIFSGGTPFLLMKAKHGETFLLPGPHTKERKRSITLCVSGLRDQPENTFFTFSTGAYRQFLFRQLRQQC
jgi:hypothetical protein